MLAWLCCYVVIRRLHVAWHDVRMADCCVDGVGMRLDGVVSIVCVHACVHCVMCDMCVALEVSESTRGRSRQ